MVEPQSVQELLYPDTTCFGCGHANPDGFRLRSYRDGERAVGEFTPGPEHDNGFGFLNGGIIATVLDCHGAAMVMSEADTARSDREADHVPRWRRRGRDRRAVRTRVRREDPSGDDRSLATFSGSSDFSGA